MSRNSINLLNKSVVLSAADSSVIVSGIITSVMQARSPDCYVIEVNDLKMHTIVISQQNLTSLGWVKEVTQDFQLNGEKFTVHVYSKVG